MNLFEMAKIPLNKAIEVMKLDPSAADIIATPERTLEVSIPVRMYRLSQSAQHHYGAG